MSVNSYLQTLASSLVLSDTEKSSIKTSIEALKRNLSYCSDRDDIKETLIFGSFTRSTILPRKYDDNSDIDFMVIFDNTYDYMPQTFLNRLKRISETYYLRSEIYQSSPTIVLELNHIKFELVPAYKEYWWEDSYKIPSGSNSWQTTEPRSDDDKLTQCNSTNNYIIKPVIRLIKLWNIRANNRKDKSFEIERKIANASYWYCSNYTDYLKQALRAIKTLENGANVDKAIDGINKALDYEAKGWNISAEAEINKIFPKG